MFTPPANEGQLGWVTLADGRRAYRYPESDELTIPGADDQSAQYLGAVECRTRE